MKKLILCLVLLCLVCIPNVAFADVMDDLDDSINNGLDNIDLSELESATSGYIDGLIDKIHSIIDGDFDTAESFVGYVINLLSADLKSLFACLISIFVVIVVLGLIRNTSNGFISESTDAVVSFVGISIVICSLITLVIRCVKSVNDCLTTVSYLAEVSTPIMLMLLVANGGSSVSAVCQPSMVMFSTFIIRVIQKVVLPMVVVAFCLSLISSLSSNVKISKASSTLNNLSSWILGVIFMVFSAFTTVEGISANKIDSVSLRAVKFASKNYIPILGGYVADGFDIVVAGTSLIKNALGVVVMLVAFNMLIGPIINSVALNMGLQCVAALCEPVADQRYVKLLNSVSKTLSLLAVLVVGVLFMFCILIVIIICCANGV